MTPLEFAKFNIDNTPLFTDEDLIKTIPDKPCIVILSSINDMNNFKKLFAEIRPDCSVKNLEFSFSKNGKEIFPPIKHPGEKPVYFNSEVLKMALLNIVHYHNKPFNIAY